MAGFVCRRREWEGVSGCLGSGFLRGLWEYNHIIDIVGV